MPPTQFQPTSYQTPEQASNKRMWLLLGGAVIVVIIVIVLVVRHLAAHASGTLVINTNSANNNITVEQSVAAGAKEGTPLQTLKNGKPVKLSAGTYLLSVTGTYSSGARTVTVKPGKVTTYTLNIAQATDTTELVANVNATNFVVGGSALYFINQSTKNLYGIDANNHVTQLSDVQFDNVHWADASFGVGRSTDNKIYAIEDGVVSQIKNVPQGINSKTDINVAPDKYIYMAVGANVYGGTAANGLTRLYTAPHSPVSVFGASSKQVAVAYTAGEDSGKEPVLTILINGKKTAEGDVEGYEFAWSPDGKHLAASADTATQVYDTSLKQVAIIARDNANNLTWSGNNKILYSSEDELWEFTMSSANSSAEIATTQQDHDISNIIVDPTTSYAYLAVQDIALHNDTFSVYRYAPVKVTKFIGLLQNQLPGVQGGCSYGLINFIGTPVVQYYASTPYDTCDDAAQQYVQQFNVDPSQVTFEQIPTLLTGVAPVQTGTGPTGQN